MYVYSVLDMILVIFWILIYLIFKKVCEENILYVLFYEWRNWGLEKFWGKIEKCFNLSVGIGIYVCNYYIL